MFVNDGNTIYNKTHSEYVDDGIGKKIIIADLSEYKHIFNTILFRYGLDKSDNKKLFMFIVEYTIICFHQHEFDHSNMADEAIILLTAEVVMSKPISNNTIMFICKSLQKYCANLLDYLYSCIELTINSDRHDLTEFLPYKWNFITDDSVELSLLH